MIARALAGVQKAGVAVQRTLCSAAVAADPIQAYREHPQSHYKFPVEGVEFSVGKHFTRGDPAPMIKHVDHESEFPGIHHITPWAKTAFCFFGEKGNIGKKTKFTTSQDGIISDPLEAQHEITLVSDGICGSAGSNEDLMDYCSWLDAIREKYVEHLVSEYDSYPVLQKKFGALMDGGDEEVLAKMLQMIVHSPVKYAKAPDGFEDKTRPLIPMRQKLYYRGKPSRSHKIRSERDEEMLKRGYVRKHVPLYTRNGNEIPLTEAQLFSGTVVSVESRLLCNLYDVGGNIGASFKRNMYSVVQLEEEGAAAHTPHSPFQDYNL